MTKQPSVSVIVPLYNEEAFIEECLRRINAQDYPIAEILLINNNSTDSSVELAQALKIPNLKVLDQSKQQGVVATRHFGFRKARSDIIATLDADSMVDESWLSTYLQAMYAGDHVAVSGYLKTYEGGWRWLTAVISNFFAFTLNKFISGHPMLFGSNYAVRKDFWNSIRDQLTTDEDIWEDLDTAIIISKNGGSIATVKKQLVGISIRILSTSRANLSNRLQQWTRTYQPHNKRAAILTIPIRWTLLFITLVLRPLAISKYQPRS